MFTVCQFMSCLHIYYGSCFHLHLLFFVVMYTAGGGLSGDGEYCPDNGDSVWSSFWEGHSERWPLGSLQWAAVGTKESGDGTSLGSSQLDSLLKLTLSLKLNSCDTNLAYIMAGVGCGLQDSARLLCCHTFGEQS